MCDIPTFVVSGTAVGFGLGAVGQPAGVDDGPVEAAGTESFLTGGLVFDLGTHGHAGQELAGGLEPVTAAIAPRPTSKRTTAPLAVSAGASVKAVQRMLGHASAAMTLDVYAGLFDDELDDVADRMGAAAQAARSAEAVSTEQGPDGDQATEDEGRDDA